MIIHWSGTDHDNLLISQSTWSPGCLCHRSFSPGACCFFLWAVSMQCSVTTAWFVWPPSLWHPPCLLPSRVKNGVPRPTQLPSVDPDSCWHRVKNDVPDQHSFLLLLTPTAADTEWRMMCPDQHSFLLLTPTAADTHPCTPTQGADCDT